MKLGDYLKTTNQNLGSMGDGKQYLSKKPNQKKRRIKCAIIAHSNCPDGMATVILSRVLYPTVVFFYGIHNSINETVLRTVKNIEEDGVLWIADICCDQKVLDEVFAIASQKSVFIGIYEHHVSKNWLQSYQIPANAKGEIVYHEEKCAGLIIYDHYKERFPAIKKYSDFIYLTNDRDLWINQDKRNILMVKLHQILGDKEYVERFTNNSSTELAKEEQILVDYTLKLDNLRKEKLLRDLKIKIDDNNYKYAIIYGEGESSDLLNSAIKKYDLEYAILLNLNTKKGSIRSRGNFNCATFSEKLGGGGHRCASGFRLNFKAPEF